MQEVIVHTIKMGDVDDPDLHVAQPIYEWQQSEEGKWIMEHSVEKPMWRRSPNPYNFYYSYDIVAWLSDIDLTYWKLKYE